MSDLTQQDLIVAEGCRPDGTRGVTVWFPDGDSSGWWVTADGGLVASGDGPAPTYDGVLPGGVYVEAGWASADGTVILHSTGHTASCALVDPAPAETAPIVAAVAPGGPQTLPVTGSSGTACIGAVGAVLVAVGVLLVVIGRRVRSRVCSG